MLHTHSFIYHRCCIMFLSLYFSFPCQYHSTNAPYSFIHLPPTLYNVFLPVLQFSPVSITPPMLHTHSFIYHRCCIMFLSLYFSFSCQYHSTNAPYSYIYLPPTLYNVFLPVLQFPLSVSFNQCSILIHSSTRTLYNIFLPVLQFLLSVSFYQCSILIHSSTRTLYNIFLPVRQFPLSVSFHQCSILIHSSTTDAL